MQRECELPSPGSITAGVQFQLGGKSQRRGANFSYQSKVELKDVENTGTVS